MTIWEYKTNTNSVDRSVLTEPNCLFCSSKMESLEKLFEESLEDNYEEITQVQICPVCGWWKYLLAVQAIEPMGITTYPQELSEIQPWDFAGGASDGIEYRWGAIYGTIGSLKELDLVDISLPVEDVRSYLMVRYSERFKIHPKLFEETVASVFKDLGYHSRVTSYSGDGGIDIILDGPNNKTIGVQVKRYKNTIEVEQIRSLAGALFIGGHTKGVFVTTSKFQSGAGKVCDIAATRGLPIELIDAEKLFSAMEIAQREKYKYKNDPMAPFHKIDPYFLKHLAPL